MLNIKTPLMLTMFLMLLSCNLASARTPIDASANIALDVVDTPASPLITAHLSQQNNVLIISGEVHKRNSASLNGYVFLRIIGLDGQALWQKRAELTPSGLRFHRYRVFEEQGPSLPLIGSKVVVEFKKLDEAMSAEIFKSDAQVSFTL